MRQYGTVAPYLTRIRIGNDAPLLATSIIVKSYMYTLNEMKFSLASQIDLILLILMILLSTSLFLILLTLLTSKLI